VEKVFIYDTTLRDGAQTPGIAFSEGDKVRIAHRLDDLGVDFIEAGWPSPGNARDTAVFAALREKPLTHAQLTAFGSTCRPGAPAGEDPLLQALVASQAPAVTIFGKAWNLHVTGALHITLDDNLRLIEDSVAWLRSQQVKVLYDAEHFFDGYAADPGYALATLQAAANAGAECLILCDTNGGALPSAVRAACRAAREAAGAPLGIHTHNDGGLAVANTLTAVEEGCRHVQGTFNGYGERCGNADLCTIIPLLEIKLGMRALPEGQLARLYDAAHFVAEVANVRPPEREPYVGAEAFTHKAGVHIDSLVKLKGSYEHITPEQVGNMARYALSDQAGGAAIVERAERLGIALDKKSAATKQILARVKEAEHEGYEFEAAEASFELLLRRELGLLTPAFEVVDFRIIVGHLEPIKQARAGAEAISEAIVRVKIGQKEEHTGADGDGPVHAVDSALRKALERHFPPLRHMRLTDFKVRVVNVRAGTAARVRVLVETTDDTGRTWSTVGAHENIIVASIEALCDALHYGLMSATPII
jgi:2-isopropylmalate synthase